MTLRFPISRPLMFCAALSLVGACSGGYDWDIRSAGNGFDTTGAVHKAVVARPRPDARGIISYPGYQVVVAHAGDSVTSVANRIGVNPGSLARYNGMSPDAALRESEVLALPGRVAEPTVATGAVVGSDNGQIDLATLAEGAIDRASGSQSGTTPAKASTPVIQKGAQPLRHKVSRGETAYSIARLYNLPVKSLADWNGLDANLDVREGQILLIPVAQPGAAAPAKTVVTPPGRPSPTPEPPSAKKPLPASNPTPITAPPPKAPPSPDLAKERTRASSSQLGMPVEGKIIRSYVKGKSHGIDISAPAGTPVKAAADGEVAAITQDVGHVPFMFVRHKNNLLTVYAYVDAIKVKKGEKVKRGQPIAVVRKGNPAFIHFEVRKGFDSVDPMPYLQ